MLRTSIRAIEVRSHAGPQVLGLADIDHLAGLVAHQIDAWARRKVGQFFIDGKHRHEYIRLKIFWTPRGPRRVFYDWTLRGFVRLRESPDHELGFKTFKQFNPFKTFGTFERSELV